MSFYLSDPYTLLLILFAIFISIISLKDNKRIPLLITSPFNQKYSIKYPRFDSLFFTFCCVINILTIHSILISFYVFKISEKMSFILFLKILSLLLLWFIVKLIIIFLVGLLLNLEAEVKKYYHEYYTNLLRISLYFFPIIIITSYSFNGALLNQYSIYCYYLFVTIYFFIKSIQLSRLNLFKLRLMFYNILYLYVLEVLPYVILLKFLQKLS